MTLGCVMILTQGHFGRINVTGRKSAKFVSDLYFFLEKKMDFCSSHQDCYDLKVCHQYDHGHMDYFNVIGRKIVYLCLVPIFLWKIMRISYFTKNVCHDFVLISRSLKKVYALSLLYNFNFVKKKHLWYLLYKKIS